MKINCAQVVVNPQNLRPKTAEAPRLALWSFTSFPYV
jgi:hypothetical protein